MKSTFLKGRPLLPVQRSSPSLRSTSSDRNHLLYPVAVGGPITKRTDTLAADFEKENARIKVKPYIRVPIRRPGC